MSGMDSRLPNADPSFSDAVPRTAIRAAADAAPGCADADTVSKCPEGNNATSPRLVIRGESMGTPHTQLGGESLEIVAGYDGKARILTTPLPRDGVPPFAALTDWLNVTFPFDSTSPGIAIVELVQQIQQYLTPKFGGMVDRGRGLHGYRHSFAFDNAGVMFCYGGQRDTAFLSIPGEGCALVSDWAIAVPFLRDVLKARITRWDGAVDDFAGEYSVDTAMGWYLNIAS